MARRLLSVTRLAVQQRRYLCTQQVSVSVKDDRVQELLTKLTTMDFDLVFTPRPEPLTVPRYKLMTMKELKEAQLEAEQAAKRLLKMPPVLPVRSPKEEVLEKDEKLEGATEHTMIFTDTTHHKQNRHRRIVAREPDGTLREASWEERDRMCQLFFPILGRNMTLPDMLTPEELPEVLQRKSTSLLNILDTVGVQCEPNSEHYIRVHATVYDHVDSNGLYEELKSTKYYSLLVWHLLIHNRINGLLADMVKQECPPAAAMLIELYLLCYPDCEFSTQIKNTSDNVTPQGTELVKMYCAHCGLTELEQLLVDKSEPDSNSHNVSVA